MEKTIETIKGEENVIIMCDWNAIVRGEKFKNIVGKYELGKKNDREDRLVDFCAKINLVITNT